MEKDIIIQQNIIENVKLLLDINDDKNDKKMIYFVNKYIGLINHYCHTVDFPVKLTDVVIEIVVEIMRKELNNATGTGTIEVEQMQGNNTIKSITRGDFSISFAEDKTQKTTTTAANASNVDKMLIPYINRLNLERRLEF